MGKVGSIFRDARLGKGLTMEQVSDETNISKRFLQGIEADNFDGFPGEVYILGFLRNYAEFLGLDAVKIIERYRQSDKEDEQATGQTLSSDAGDASDQGKEVKEAPAPAQVPVSTPAPAPTRTPAPSAQPAAEKTDKTDNEEASAPPQAQESSLFSEMEGQERMEGLESPPSAPSASPKKRKTSSARKSRTRTEPHEGEAKVQGEPQSPQSATTEEPSAPMQARQTAEPPPSSTHRGTSTRRVTLVQAGRLLPFILLGLVLLIAAISIIPTLKLPSGTNRTPSEYHAEGLPFEQRLYPQDKVYLPLGDDFISITLRAITDKISFDTPYGTLTVGLNEDAVMNPSADQERLVATALDYAPNEPKNGALVHFDVKEPLSTTEVSTDITVPEEASRTAAPPTAQGQTSPVVLFRSAGGPHPFHVNVSFMSPVLFRYEADRKEWVEKYYRKGESITVNASNSITFWTANAQAVKVNVFQSAGKSTELVMGGPGEIAVQRLSWSNAQGGWALVATPLD